MVEVAPCIQSLGKLGGFTKYPGGNGWFVSNSHLIFNTVLANTSKLHLNFSANNCQHMITYDFRAEALECED